MGFVSIYLWILNKCCSLLFLLKLVSLHIRNKSSRCDGSLFSFAEKLPYLGCKTRTMIYVVLIKQANLEKTNKMCLTKTETRFTVKLRVCFTAASVESSRAVQSNKNKNALQLIKVWFCSFKAYRPASSIYFPFIVT